VSAYDRLQEHLGRELDAIRAAGTYKSERVITTHQRAEIGTAERPSVLNFCANNYLGLADDPRVREAAHRALDRWGYGMASVRFICGTQTVHKELEARLSAFLGTEDTILYSSCFDANGGLFEVLLGPEDAVISDQLNHASIIDGIRLCKAKRLTYLNNDMKDLEQKLQETQSARFRLIATDGVFSMDGIVADLAAVCELADRYDALVMVDDSHSTGFMGPTGRGTPEHAGVMERIDVLTSTLGKALGGASGGFTTGRREIVELLRQRSRPYLFSNTLAPVISGTTLELLDLLERSDDLRARLHANTRQFRSGMVARGFELRASPHPIVPIMIGDAALAARMAERLLDEGIYVIGFSYPVVPRGAARIRVQLSAAHSPEQVEFAMDAFARARG
jgi:glycine C-acetyltransferase